MDPEVTVRAMSRSFVLKESCDVKPYLGAYTALQIGYSHVTCYWLREDVKPLESWQGGNQRMQDCIILGNVDPCHTLVLHDLVQRFKPDYPNGYSTYVVYHYIFRIAILQSINPIYTTF